jgi:hypothetical protein
MADFPRAIFDFATEPCNHNQENNDDAEETKNACHHVRELRAALGRERRCSLALPNPDWRLYFVTGRM